jgi:hypothetical protein
MTIGLSILPDVKAMSEAAGLAGESHDDDNPEIAAQNGGRVRRLGELKLLPYIPAQDEPPRARREEQTISAAVEAGQAKPPRDWGRIAAAASLAGVVLVGAAAAAAHVHAWRVTRAEEAQARALAHRLDGMTARLDSLDINRSRDDLANLKKVLAEIRAGAASAHEVSGAVAQLGQRVEKLEKDQSARLDKLGERIDHDSAGRLGELTARLDRLEARAAPTVATVAAAPSPALKATPTPPAKPEAAKAAPAVSNETTASIDKPRPRLRGFYVAEIHNGYAMIDSPQGEFAVTPGDVVPGGGRVLRIERHGRDWVVVTTQGQIVASD